MNPIKRLRAWWFNATHGPCPVCGELVRPSHDWDGHKGKHPRNEWRSAIGLPPLTPEEERYIREHGA